MAPEVQAREIRQEKERKGFQIGKEDPKLSLFLDDMILCIEKPKHSTKKKQNKKTVRSMNSVKLQDTKFNIQKSKVFLYTKNELSEK